MKIKQICAQEILDSRGFPTIQCSIALENGYRVQASVPAGASVGKKEAYELRDGDSSRFRGKGVLKAINNIETVLAPLLVGKEPDIFALDKIMIDADGTTDKHRLGANAILAVSMAIVRAQAHCLGLEPYSFLAQVFKPKLMRIPRCMFNILNGGMHANNKMFFQEFMIMPKFDDFFACLEGAVRIYQTLRGLLDKAGYLCSVGDEGGFAPVFSEKGKIKEKIALDYLIQAIEIAGFRVGDEVVICLDVAATHFYEKEQQQYFFEEEIYSSQEMINLYKELITSYPIYSIEDGMSEDDPEGWRLMTSQLGNRVQLVGDDIFVTNVTTILEGHKQGLANAVLIKPNQIGTVSQAYEAVKTAVAIDYKTVASHRSGETNDDFIADFAVGCGIDHLKAGAPARGERVAKYNRLLTIARSY